MVVVFEGVAVRCSGGRSDGSMHAVGSFDYTTK
jgi:hypothetical protein